MRVFVTGGAGFIGTHTLVELLRAGHEVHVYDSFANASRVALDRVGELTDTTVPLTEGDIRDQAALEAALGRVRPDAVIHFAGRKAVGESTAEPLLYYDHNVVGMQRLLAAMTRTGVGRIVFSSSATVYGDPDTVPIAEGAPLRPANPYGRTKMISELMIADWAAAVHGVSAVALRYFNPIGADASGRIGEDPDGVPNNLMPFITQVAIGRRARLSVFGGDWPTRDGTGERDYIHVTDLARAHVAALERQGPGFLTCNVGTGQGVTVLEMIRAFERASGREIPHDIVARRPGDVASYVASVERAAELLGWRAEHDLDAMCASAWAWQTANPRGYGTDG